MSRRRLWLRKASEQARHIKPVGADLWESLLQIFLMHVIIRQKACFEKTSERCECTFRLLCSCFLLSSINHLQSRLAWPYNPKDFCSDSRELPCLLWPSNSRPSNSFFTVSLSWTLFFRSYIPPTLKMDVTRLRYKDHRKTRILSGGIWNEFPLPKWKYLCSVFWQWLFSFRKR